MLTSSNSRRQNDILRCRAILFGDIFRENFDSAIWCSSIQKIKQLERAHSRARRLRKQSCKIEFKAQFMRRQRYASGAAQRRVGAERLQLDETYDCDEHRRCRYRHVQRVAYRTFACERFVSASRRRRIEASARSMPLPAVASAQRWR